MEINSDEEEEKGVFLDKPYCQNQLIIIINGVRMINLGLLGTGCIDR